MNLDRFDLEHWDQEVLGQRPIIRATCRMCGRVVFDAASGELALAEAMLGPTAVLLICSMMALDVELHHFYCSSAKVN